MIPLCPIEIVFILTLSPTAKIVLEAAHLFESNLNDLKCEYNPVGLQTQKQLMGKILTFAMSLIYLLGGYYVWYISCIVGRPIEVKTVVKKIRGQVTACSTEALLHGR